ncbi:MAG TPA: glycoside hydrolase family 15 protein [Rhizomicrobium sp.]|nr:glycoside hydrolase family 15 protein [Rhizomicrobium sp.]
MPGRIEDYAVIGNCETMALVSREGSIDWLCLPRFDRAACFAALLGDRDNGRWLITTADPDPKISRQYCEDTLVLETTFETKTGSVRLTDFMFRRDGVSDVVRLVHGLKGKVEMQIELIVRFEYGSRVPWVTRRDDGRLQLISGPDRLLLDTPVELRGEDMRTVGEFEVTEGQQVAFMLSRSLSYRAEPEKLDAAAALEQIKKFWSDWAKPFQNHCEWSKLMLRSLITLKGLSHWETGGIAAAATTSLPEKIGGSRNWDYRYCWLRDATLTLFALVETGFLDEARRWREWLLRAAAGSPDQLQIMYGVAGERRVDEYEVSWLAGYENSAPVRIGNAAADQIQVDVYGEIVEAMYVARKRGLRTEAPSWELEIALLEHLAKIWDKPDHGIWEVRGERQHFTHSKVMAWVAFDRGIRSAEEFGLKAPLERWRSLRDLIHNDVCAHGFNKELNSFVQYYGSDQLDASLLQIGLVGFLPAGHPYVKGTVAAIERSLVKDGFVQRYDTHSGTDGLPPGEGVFLACSFWLVDNYVLLGRHDEAVALFKRLIALCNDVGLLAEEYDPVDKRQVGNFPQAFSHLALINSARNLSVPRGPAQERSEGTAETTRSKLQNKVDKGEAVA